MFAGREDRLLWSIMRLLTILILFLLNCKYSSAKPPETNGRVCRGAVSAVSLSHGRTPIERHKMYRQQYMNCTKVMGNLVIAFLDEEDDFDMSFLKAIQEVSGFVYIVGNHFSYLNLTSLRVIRGKTLFSPDNSSMKMYSLFVAKNYKIDSDTVGLKELGLVSLQEIMAGSVYFYDNSLLCYEQTIDWNDILMEGEVDHQNVNPNTRNCSPCHQNCAHRKDLYCWGEGPDMCQTLSKVVCSKQCESRCYGLGPSECCRPECAGGCSGPLKTDCFSCKKFVDNGTCVEQCPPMFIYHNYKWYPNPNAKYAYGNLCVDKCPVHLIADMGACVSDCSEGHRVDEDKKCVPCDGPCPKTCAGTGSDYLDASNINNFTGCTVINGNLKILQNSFTGNHHRNLSGITVDQLSVFESLQEITEFLTIQGSHEEFKNLSFLRNLVTIHGRALDSVGRPFQVYKTSLEFLGMRSLRNVDYGKPLIVLNGDLCYVDSVNWSSIVKAQQYVIKSNRNETLCEEEGKVCSPLCGSNGCWGPGDDQCLDCIGYFLGERCVASCAAYEGWFTFEQNETKECRACHLECLTSCSGENADECDSCKNFKDGPFCVDKCPSFKYPDPNGDCQPCHENCRGGCTGNDNTVGDGACNDCAIVVYEGEPLAPVQCRRAESGCGKGFYSRYIGSPNSQTEKHEACYRCHPECTECTGDDISYCSLSSCVNYVEGRRCVSQCSSDHYANATTLKCHVCSSQCLRCTGPTPYDCVKCRDLKVYNDEENIVTDPSFTCVDECPESHPVQITGEFSGVKEPVCASAAYAASINTEPKKTQLGLIIGLLVGGIAVIGIIVITVFCIKRQVVRSEENKRRWEAKLNGLDESEPLHPSLAAPDMSMLRLIKESELQRENIIGSGAFGTVYKGAWKPAKENVKIPVAIKVLQDSSSNQNKELLDEARIMASVDHPCCVHIIAVCMSSQMMLISQLMPHGCLLDYVRNNRRNISSKNLLNWSTQIAKGMNYLESLGIVHRDLAARNVLVQNPNVVKITDFGLAKLLDFNQDQFQSNGGKMPIKWLALECIHHRIFTHKSDVWSFGVTVWELYTYGQKPYENIVARDIPNLLDKGERLPQPAICTIDVYMIMIKCWMLEAESRPSFHELSEEYAKMARDPGRYLVIEGDTLMKLTDVKFKPKDLLSETDGPEQIMSADEYLQPQKLNHRDSKHMKDYQNDFPTTASKLEQNNVGLQSAAANKRREHTASRYSSDPCKMLSTKSSENHGNKNEDRQAPSSLDVPVKLPVDEDDYLHPSLSSPSTYLEMIDSDTGENAIDAVPSQPRGFASNPEYFDGNGAAVGAGQEAGNQYESSKMNPEVQPLKFRNLSSGSESEYCNEPKQPIIRKPGQNDSRPYNESEV